MPQPCTHTWMFCSRPTESASGGEGGEREPYEESLELGRFVLRDEGGRERKLGTKDVTGILVGRVPLDAGRVMQVLHALYVLAFLHADREIAHLC